MTTTDDIHFVKNTYGNHEMRFVKEISGVDVGIWVMEYLNKQDPKYRGDGEYHYKGTIDIHMLGAHILNKIKEEMGK